MSPRRAATIRLRLRNTLGSRARRQQSKQTLPAAWPKMWVSTNKVLIGSVGGLKKPHCRNPNFDCEETKLLISLWGDPQVQRTLITTHKKHPVIAKLAEKMREYGYNRSTEEINTRIKNLKCFYNRIKKDMETGVINEPSWKHFQAMDEILTRPVFGGANAASRYPPTPGAAAGGSSDAATSSGGRITRPRLSAGSVSGAELSELDPDQIEVKLELVSDEEKEMLHPEDLLKNAEQVELKEPNLLIPKDEPMEEEEVDDPNDPDFEDEGGSETDDESSGMDEADESDRSTRLRRRTRRAHKPKKTNPTAGGKNVPTTTPATASGTSTSTTTSTSTAAQPKVPSIKIINYAGGGSISLSSVANVVSAVSSGSSTVSMTTLAGRTDGGTTTTTTTTTPSKISLVPTNFLLKPQAASNLQGFKQPIQLYTKPTVSIATTKPTPGLSPIVSVNASGAGGTGVTPTTTNTVSAAGGTTSGGPMKVFLVNTLAKDGSGPKQQLITPTTGKQIYTTSTGVSLQGTSHVSGLPQISIQPKQLLTSTAGGPPTITRKIIQTSTLPSLRAAVARTAAPPPKFGGFKALLQQLVGLQRENLSITKTRLVAEKERFGNERSVANSLLDALGELNALLTEVNGELMPLGKDSDEDEGDDDGLIKISCDSPASSPARSVSRQEDSLKAEVISDSEES